ncbi:MAG TPA: hypothetical protein VNR11_03910 [Xanthobacteraceae bacterium]|nr:hypothetical protein [Xanthobacteraceae bacterium]
MSEREPDSRFPGRDTYGRGESSRRREGNNLSLIVGGAVVIALVVALIYLIGTGG